MTKYSLYTVYDNRTDEPIVIDGTIEECVKKMGIRENSFYSTLWHIRRGDKTRWSILISKPVDSLSIQGTFGQKVRHHRRSQGLTLKDLAEEVGVTASTIHCYEIDKYEPTLFTALCIADVLGLSLDYLAGRTNKA